MLLAISILAALYRRRDTGQGERIEIAMQDAMLQYIRVALSNQATYGVAAKRNGSKVISGFAVPSGIYPCKPGGPNDYLYVYTSRTNPAHWRRLLEVIGRKELIGDPRFDTGVARKEREPEIDEDKFKWRRNGHIDDIRCECDDCHELRVSQREGPNLFAIALCVILALFWVALLWIRLFG
jgi:formyl-CoA transferase